MNNIDTMDNSKKFNGRAAVYTASRPSYSNSLIDCLCQSYGLSGASAIADIGSGTGKFSRQILELGIPVFCVEPNDEMRHIAQLELDSYSNFYSVDGSAERTNLKDNSVDWILSAQAFHWFDTDKFKQECKRILKKGGRVALIWNMRDMNESLNQDWSKVFERYCPAFCGFSSGIQQDDSKIKSFFETELDSGFGLGYEFISFDHTLIFDREKFIERSLSSSYSLQSGDADFSSYIDALNRVFDTYEQEGKVAIVNKSIAYISKSMI